MNKYKIIVSGGGTGGHIFPAISIANTLKQRFPEAEIRFVGADNRMEMERVPAAGYPIVGLPICGFDRAHLWKNIEVVKAILKATDKPDSLIKYVTDRPGHDLRYAIDAAKIGRELSWQPQETFESGMRKTVQWYLDNKIWWQRILDGRYRLERLGHLSIQ